MNTASPSASSPGQARPSRWRRLLGNLALSFCSFFLFAGMVELALRLMGYGNLEIYQPDPVVYWRLKPNQDCYTKVDHKPVHINSQGTRGPEFILPKQAGAIRILSLGDSRTFGWGLSDEQTYSRQVEAELQKHFGSGRKVEVINAGVNAWSYPQMTAFFREFGLKYEPDCVIVGDANFWTQFSDRNSPEFVRSFMRRVWLKNFLRRFAIYHYVVEVKLQDVYQRYRVKFVPIDPKQDTLFKEQQQKDPEAFVREAIEQLCQTALSNRVAPVLLYLPTEDETNRTTQLSLHRTKEQIAQKLNVPLVDLSTNILHAGRKLYLDADPVHFNAEGNQIISQRLVAALTNVLGAAITGSGRTSSPVRDSSSQ